MSAIAPYLTINASRLVVGSQIIITLSSMILTCLIFSCPTKSIAFSISLRIAFSISFFSFSYYDTNIGTHNVVYTGIEDSDNYDHIYQSDLCGWVGQLGYNKESIYGANVYTAESNQNLTAASFYATGKDSEYQLYVVKNFEDESSLSNMTPVASGILSNAGYYTIPFDKQIALDAGERYAVVLFISTPDAVHPLAIEYEADDATADVVLDDGEGYVSANGFEWENVKNVENCNICIKAFSNDR
jgi:hypothetical protein